jgi:general stress protein 26
VCTEKNSFKIKNIQKNPHVCLSLESGNEPLVWYVKASVIYGPFEIGIKNKFMEKYDCNLNR